MASKRKAAYHNDLGVLLEKEGELTDALEQYRLARTEEPDLDPGLYYAGNVNVKRRGRGQPGPRPLPEEYGNISFF